jgi:hypothetical protein
MAKIWIPVSVCPFSAQIQKEKTLPVKNRDYF